MKFPRFFSAGVGLPETLEASRQSGSPFLRANGLMLFAYDLATWFDENPGLESVRLSCVAQAEVSEGFAVRMRHHFKLVALPHAPTESSDRSFPCDQDDLHAYALDRLPWQQLANGSVLIERQHPALAALLALDEEEAMAEAHNHLYALANTIASGFEQPTVIHDMGLDSAFSDQD